jgi:cytochrome b pre-mRNA-processing protein 3
MLNALKKRGARRAVVERLWTAVSARAREEVFFRELQVADTFDGRFDVLALHLWLLMDELRSRQEDEIAQQFVDTAFVQFDEALRELGASDVGMSRRMKKMASALFGRLEAYRAATDEGALAEAIARNVYRGVEHGIESARMLASYCITARAHLAQSKPESGAVDFGPLPVLTG